MIAGDLEGGLTPIPTNNLSFRRLRDAALSELEWVLKNAKRPSVRLGAIREILSRTDPPPRSEVHIETHGPTLVTWQHPSLESSPSSPPALASGPSTSNGNASPSSSATEDSGKPSWL